MCRKQIRHAAVAAAASLTANFKVIYVQVLVEVGGDDGCGCGGGKKVARKVLHTL